MPSIKHAAQAAPIIAVSDDIDLPIAQQALLLGASACVSKMSSYNELVKAIKIVKAGKSYLSPELKQSATKPASRHGDESNLDVVYSLSERQKEVLKHIARGTSNKGISIEMNISQNTVKAHLATIFKILGVHNRTEAFYFAARAGMSLDD